MYLNGCNRFQKFQPSQVFSIVLAQGISVKGLKD